MRVFGARVTFDALAGCDCALGDCECKRRTPANSTPAQLSAVITALMLTKEIIEMHVTRHTLQVVVSVPEDVAPPVLTTLRKRYQQVATEAWDQAKQRDELEVSLDYKDVP
jgi:hypothetical protein